MPGTSLPEIENAGLDRLKLIGRLSRICHARLDRIRSAPPLVPSLSAIRAGRAVPGGDGPPQRPVRPVLAGRLRLFNVLSLALDYDVFGPDAFQVPLALTMGVFCPVVLIAIVSLRGSPTMLRMAGAMLATVLVDIAIALNSARLAPPEHAASYIILAAIVPPRRTHLAVAVPTYRRLLRHVLRALCRADPRLRSRRARTGRLAAPRLGTDPGAAQARVFAGMGGEDGVSSRPAGEAPGGGVGPRQCAADHPVGDGFPHAPAEPAPFLRTPRSDVAGGRRRGPLARCRLRGYRSFQTLQRRGRPPCR